MKCDNFVCKNEATKRLKDKEKGIQINVCDFHYERDFSDDPRVRVEEK